MAAFLSLSVLVSLAALVSALCDPGFEPRPYSNDCSPCQPGFFALGGDALCQRCCEGAFQPLSAQPACIPCPVAVPLLFNVRTALAASPEVTLAPADSVDPEESTVPEESIAPEDPGQSIESTDCPPGFGADFNGCAPCQPGFASLLPSACVPCPPQTFQSLPEQSECLPCPQGTFSNGDTTDCLDPSTFCPPGSEFSEDVAFCIPCRPGFFGFGAGPCEPCPEGQVQPDEDQSSCIVCPEGSRPNDDSTACISTIGGCDPGFVFNDELGFCTGCDPGFFGSAPGTCERCPEGQIQPGSGQLTCTLCPGGTRANMDATSCDQVMVTCGPGFDFRQEIGFCAPCAPSFFGSGSGPCEPCPEGQVQSNEARSSCVVCPEGSLPNDSSTACISTIGGCDPGFVFNEELGVCTRCEPGFFGSAPGTCERCPEGQIQTDTGQLDCIPCPGGTRPNMDATACDQVVTCSPGSEFFLDVGFCIPCRPGFFGSGSGFCAPCPEGQVQPDEGRLSCIVCPESSRPNDISTDCVSTP